MRKKMSEVDGVLRTMEFGVSTGLRLAKDTLELMLRFVNFLIARYEKSKEFNMKYEEMNKAQRQRRNGYLQAKQMKKIMEKTGECMVPIALENGREMSEAELDKLAMYAEMMNFPYTFLEEEIVDRDGNLVLDEEGYPKVKRTYFVLQSDLDKMNIFVQTLNRDRQHEIVEKSDLMPEEKDQLHDDINAENTFGDNEKVVKETVVRNKEFHEALKKAYEEKDYSMLEKVMKDEKIKFYNSPEQAKGGEKNNFTIVMNKNARRDYSRGQNYYVVDAINPNHYIELTSTYNEKQKRTDTSYTVYKNSEVIFETNDRLTDEDVQKAAVTKSWKGWNPRWNEIREEIKEAGGFKQDAHYFVFNTQAEFENYRSLYEQNVERYTIKPEDIINGMDYTEAKATIDMQMKTNHFFVQMREQGLSQGEIEKNRLSEQDLSKYEAAQQVDYRIFVNNMTQKGLNLDKRIVDNKKIEDHHALIVTENIKNVNFLELTTKEKNILNLVISRMLLAFDTVMKYDETRVYLNVAGHVFQTSGITVVDEGWKKTEKKLFHKQEKQNDNLPKMDIGEEIPVTEINRLCKKTQPPQPYTYDTLLAAMKNAGDKIEIGDEMVPMGIGTGATRAGIIGELYKKGFLENFTKDKRSYINPTRKALFASTVFPKSLLSPEMTARWQYKINQIEQKELSADVFIEEVKHFVAEIINEAEKNTTSYNGLFSDNQEVVGKCRWCGENIYQKGNIYKCENEKCGFFISAEKNAISLFHYKKPLSFNQIKKLLSDKGLTLECKSKVGNQYTANFKIKAKPKFDGEKKYPDIYMTFVPRKVKKDRV